MKCSVKFYAEIDIEGHDEAACDEVRKSIEIQSAIMCERFEAILIGQVAPLHPNCKFRVGPEINEESD